MSVAADLVRRSVETTLGAVDEEILRGDSV
jgi:hypothetical protein